MCSDEEVFVDALETELDMRSVLFANGFWREFAVFLESAAFRESIEELAMGLHLVRR
jgi:hypothetical protein